MVELCDGSGISWTICKQSAPRPRQITTPTPHHSIFTDRMLFLVPNQQRQSTEGSVVNTEKLVIKMLLSRQTVLHASLFAISCFLYSRHLGIR